MMIERPFLCVMDHKHLLAVIRAGSVPMRHVVCEGLSALCRLEVALVAHYELKLQVVYLHFITHLRGNYVK